MSRESRISSPVAISATFVASVDQDSFPPRLIRDDIETRAGEAQPRVLPPSYGGLVCEVLSEKHTELLLERLRTVKHFTIEALPCLTMESGSTHSLAFGSWNVEVVPKLDTQGYKITVESWFSFANHPAEKAETLVIWNGQTVVFQLFDAGNPAALLFLRVEGSQGQGEDPGTGETTY